MRKETQLTLILVIAGFAGGCSSPQQAANSIVLPKIDIRMPEITTNTSVESNTGQEKRKPARGKANLQGRVLYAGKPAAGVEVRLCENLSTVLGLDCSGKNFKVKTDTKGEYLISDVPAMEYEGVAVRVFSTSRYVYLASMIYSSAKYDLEADKTFFAPDTDLFKSDLRIISPKNHATVDASDAEFKWAPYPDASYYVYSLSSENSVSKYMNIRTDQPAFKLDTPIPSDTYLLKVEAFNSSGVKLAESTEDYGFYLKSSGK
ncbi:MAG: hypothetical protein ABI878_15640 [Acidobacteriota bacterium]